MKPLQFFVCLFVLALAPASLVAGADRNLLRVPSPFAAISVQPTLAAGNLSVPRLDATAVLLADGKVLIAGGQGPWMGNGLDVQATAELFDPVTNTFAVTGAMNIPRVGHTATLLSDGRVLVVGGVNAANYGAALSTAELYDPASGLFALTGDLNRGREHPTTTPLADGTVLIAGGWNGRKLQDAEVYDPLTGHFTLVGPMSIPRAAHTAAAFSDGRVLIAGGDASEEGAHSAIASSSAEIYDPMTRLFAPVGAMGRARWGPVAASLSDGRVLIVGGWGGEGSGTEYTSEIFDPKSGAFQPGPSMSTPMVWAGTATRLQNGTVLVAGGLLDGDEFLGATDALRIFDPMTNTFVEGPAALQQHRAFHTATLMQDGRVLISGGSDGSAVSVSSTVELYVGARPRTRPTSRR